MKIKPIITEKSLEKAKSGEYTFSVGKNITKYQAKEKIEKLFGVQVTRVRTISIPGIVKKTNKGRKQKIGPSKKAIVKLAEKQKIDLFDIKT